ncbi:DUF262 and DUF1524 domain-containing protein [Clostridium estertheticum]|uniref:DUF262 domain-containing protein n=1 Tax=Clostridium estertheticum TaxID=238834 RepID=A0A7Y3SZZ6_9CLOT|nr:DUF262 and DUF1524 domain-containing protein [Clostridium estertheticum]NNU78362.1 DUF262 domain-containing protein [Clostridium estertheticum]WBL45284.1 DUF262 and DUF1524 domain-containing protein [Clostridium estertheticum]
MKAGETTLIKLMQGAVQFVVPIYQRTYSWSFKQCDQLWKDIIQITLKQDDSVHFIGSVVYIDLGTPHGKPQQLLLIDGQQRLSTLSLLLCALSRYVEDNKLEDKINPNKIKNYFLINSEESGMDKYKLILTEQDKDTFIHILNKTEKNVFNPSVQILKNFNHFSEIIQNSEVSIENIYEGINRLMLVSVALDKSQDNPQLIFESMNSTGKDLSQADLIRNYILMGQPTSEQDKLYSTYWRPMEQGFGQQGYADYFDLFIRDFLTIHNNGKICKINEVYETFKIYHKSGVTNEQLLVDVFTFSKYYISMYFCKDTDKDLNWLWGELKELDVNVWFPFLMRVYYDYDTNKISKADFITIIKLTISYIVRRVICEIPTNSLNKTFATFYGKIKQDNYATSVLAEYAVKDSYRAFPTNEEFKEKLIVKSIYNLRIKNYILEALENQNHKEPINITRDGYTIEHIMPQNPELKKEWQDMLGVNWKEVQKNYLHTLGNLTLTGYNSELSDSPFNIKQEIKGGFKDSHLRLNDALGGLSKWDETEIINRVKTLANQAVTIWEYPKVSKVDIEEYTKKDKVDIIYSSIDHYQSMLPEIAAIYEKLDRKILSLDVAIRKEYKKDYIAYKVDTNFTDIEPYKQHLKLWVNMPFDSVDDPKELFKDVTNIGHMGNGGAEIKIMTTTDLDAVMEIIKQSLRLQIE